jgi:RpiR family carbohydrate utilization transcriptional regulator
LAALSQVPIHLNVNEQNELHTPLTSRIVHLAVIDVLVMGVARQRGEGLLRHLAQLQQSLEQLRVPPHGQQGKPLLESDE